MIELQIGRHYPTGTCTYNVADFDWRENTATIHGNEVYVYWKCKLNNQVCILRDYMGETIDSIIDKSL